MNEFFVFEFHSFLPLFTAKTYNDAVSTCTAQIFGRAFSGESVCMNVIGLCPYFYIQIEGAVSEDSIFGGEDRLKAAGLNSGQFSLSKVEKIAFYQFQVRYNIFFKVSCCNEGIRKRLIDYAKVNSDLNLKIFEGHISYTLQFMSDFGIVGMGNVILRSCSRIPHEEASSRCDLEIVAHHSDIVNNCTTSQSTDPPCRALLRTLSVFLDNLGVNSLPQRKMHNEPSEQVDPLSIYDLWSQQTKAFSQPNRIRITDPTFKNYTYRYPPPPVDSNYAVEPVSQVKQCLDLSVLNVRPDGRIFTYTPNIDPPLLKDFAHAGRTSSLKTTSLEDMIDCLSMNTKTAQSMEMYSFNGDFYLKIMAMEAFTCPQTGSLLVIAVTIIYREVTTTTILKLDSVCANLKPNGCSNLLSYSDEYDLLQGLIDLLYKEDPDILSGYDVDNYSWGMLSRRFSTMYPDTAFETVLSRVKTGKRSSIDPWIAKSSSQFQVPGRIVFNLWRIFKGELALRSYTPANVAKHYFSSFCPEIDNDALSELITNYPFDFLRHCYQKVKQTADLTFRTPFLVKAIEFSRLLGIDLFSTLTRGSQYRVESIMIRAAHAEDYLLRTPSESDVNAMRAAQGLPLVLEPESQLYRDPVVVLDFQSLYPSLIIAYNYCYSTIIGSMNSDQVRTCGFIHNPQPSEYGLESKEDLLSFDLFVAPENISFVQKSVKVGLLPRMLEEILRARLIIKNAMKSCDPKLRHVMDARQLALKYIANVTYGYTSASFSGRMPNVDIADSIVLSGRKTLERAIDFIESTSKWAAKVVYGDTDSLFVLLPGRSREEAFILGKEVADAITSLNPDPITLKFEKVYHPCVLMTKKRYCGYKYETIDSDPVFDAKGIETVRRDGCPLAAKILEKSLRLLFTGHDIDFIKAYVQRQMIKILSYRKLNLADFVFAREVRLGSYKSEQESRLPLSAIAAKQAQARDPFRLIPYGQRVPFVIISKPFSKLYQQVLHLNEFVRASPNQRLDVIYYVTKQIIPVLSRSLLIDGVDVFRWYNELPLSALRHACHANKSISIFGGSVDRSHCSSLHQQAQLLQDLLLTEKHLRLAHSHSCGRFGHCRTLCCKDFWNHFSFLHVNGQTMEALYRQLFE